MKHLIGLSLLLYSFHSGAFNRCEETLPSIDNPAFPAIKVYKTLICEKRPANKILIGDLEKLLFHRSFKLPIEKDGATYRLHVGTAGSFSLWRDLINLNLGRAYYEEGELRKSLSYWDNISGHSPYYPMAVFESNYARLKLKDFNNLKKKLQTLNALKLQGEDHNEKILQEALYQLRTGNFTESADMVKDLVFTTLELQELKQKVIAESLFSKYLRTHTGLPFEEKVSTLKIITDAVETIRPDQRDENLIYLAAEAYWHTAVAYRIEDPVKHQNIWHKQLETADAWISPAVEKSISEGKAHLSEEAFFFSIALLWEREFQSKALVRLKNLDVIYPLGVYREDAYQLLGDYYFDEQDFKGAIPYYRKLAQVGSESKAAYGVYKAAWSFYNAKDKWKSLRHFERLFQFYIDKGKKDADKNELMKEARQDLLLLISEVLPSEKGIEELKTFKISGNDTKEMIRDLAKLYQRNGNYKESTETWNYLLKHYLADVEAPQWIIQNALDFYADGKRDEISKQIKKHYLPWKEKHFSHDGDKHVAAEWTKIILSLHREAKKSEDPLFWKSTDLAYETYEELRPDGQEGEVWYFGAQKFQSQNNFWRSVQWFKRAADVKGYAMADDAALSALGLLNDKSGELSLLEDKTPVKAEYSKLTKYSHWFFSRPSEKLAKQKELAHFIYSEALFFTGEFLKAREFLASLFNHPEQNEELWNVYLSHNKRLYKASAWNESHVLALVLQNTKLGQMKEKLTFLANVAQENAFQLAYEAEKAKEQDIVSLRKWYEIAYSLPHADEAVKLKAWHNYLLSFNPDEVELFENKLKEFTSLREGKTSEDIAGTELNFNIYAKALKVFEGARLPYKKGPYLYLASRFTTDSQLKESLLWDALVLHATYHQWDHFEERLAELEELKSEYVQVPKFQTAIARFQFLKQDYEKSWKLSQALLLKDKDQGAVWINVSDLYLQGKFSDEIASFLLDNEKNFQDVAWIRPLWAVIKEKEFLANSDLSEIKADRQPASVKAEDSEVIQAFKERMALIGSAYRLMNAKKDKLKTAVIPWIPATGAHAVCASPAITQETSLSLMDLKKIPIASEQWPQFTAKLDEKINELHALMEKEKESCEKVKDEIVFIGGFTPAVSPIASPHEVDQEKVMALENKTSDAKDRFVASLASGARAQAEMYAANEKDPGLQAYFYSLLRLASNDVWNAYILLEDLQKKKGWDKHALYLKSLIAEKNGRQDLAKKFGKDHQIAFSDWEERLLSNSR